MIETKNIIQNYLKYILVILIFIALILMLCSNKHKYLYIIVIIIIAIIILLLLQSNNNPIEKFVLEKSTVPLVLTPESGYKISDSDVDSDVDSDDPDKDSDKESEQSNFNKEKMFFNYGKDNSRQFYFVPNSIQNDQPSFAEWLYRAPRTCKENNMYCLKYEDVRFNRHNPDIDNIDQLSIV